VVAGYDSIGQLTSWKAREGVSGPLRLNEQVAWVYDAAGNLLYRTNGGLIQTFTTDPVNQLANVARNTAMTVSGVTPTPATSVTVNGQSAQTYGDFTFARTNVTLSNGNNTFAIVAHSAAGTNATNNLTVNLPSSVTLLYDANGNLTNDGTRSFSYDAENRMVTNWVASAWKSEFVYDGLGRRRIERDYGLQGSQWVKTNETRYVYDGYLAIQERDSNNVARVTYTRGLDLSATLAGAGGIGGLLARTDGNGSTFYHADGAGNVTALMDGQQNMAARYLYSPFGRLIGKWGPMADGNVMQFSSMPVHRQSGLNLYPFRAYDPSLQQFISRDPIGEMGGLNLYRFVYNNPLKWVDPWGFQGAQLELDLEREFEGEITRELREGLSRNRIPSILERIGDNASLNAKATEMRQQGLDPNMKYIGALKEPTKPPTPEEMAQYLRDHPIQQGLFPPEQIELALTYPRPGNRGPTSATLCYKGNQVAFGSGKTGTPISLPSGTRAG